jgi:hypothetical protein
LSFDFIHAEINQPHLSVEYAMPSRTDERFRRIVFHKLRSLRTVSLAIRFSNCFIAIGNHLKALIEFEFSHSCVKADDAIQIGLQSGDLLRLEYQRSFRGPKLLA